MDEMKSVIELGEAGIEESNSWFLCDKFEGNSYFATLLHLGPG